MPENENNCPHLKKMIGLILELQEVQEHFIDLAHSMRYGSENDKRDERKVNQTNKKLDYHGDEKTSKIRRFLATPKADQKETPLQKEPLYTVLTG